MHSNGTHIEVGYIERTTQFSGKQTTYPLIDLVGRVDDGKTLYKGLSFMLAVIAFQNTSFGDLSGFGLKL